MGGWVDRDKGKGKKGSNDSELDKIERRANWLSRNVFPDCPLDNDAINAMMGMGIARAMELFKEIEEKVDNIRNPSSYLVRAAKKEGFGPSQGGGGGDKDKGKGYGYGKGKSKGGDPGGGRGGDVNPKVAKRAEWLNERAFPDRPISRHAMEVLSELDIPSCMALFKEVEDMGSQVRNPSGFLVSKARELSSGLAVIPAAPPRDANGAKGSKAKGSSKGGVKGSAVTDEDRIEKRATFLNKNVFADRPLDDDAICALMGMGLAAATDLFQELEERAERMTNPSNYVKKAATNMGFAPAPEADEPPSRSKGKDKGKGKGSTPPPPPPARGTIAKYMGGGGGDFKKRAAPADDRPAKTVRR